MESKAGSDDWWKKMDRSTTSSDAQGVAKNFVFKEKQSQARRHFCVINESSNCRTCRNRIVELPHFPCSVVAVLTVQLVKKKVTEWLTKEERNMYKEKYNVKKQSLKQVLLHSLSLVWNRPIGNSPIGEFAQLRMAHAAQDGGYAAFNDLSIIPSTNKPTTNKPTPPKSANNGQSAQMDKANPFNQ
uniref:Uncharacterized protein n=1 Tax=Romanomermis culicivorax TaxID=13658 RepID=A0A915IXK6_ROMCU